MLTIPLTSQNRQQALAFAQEQPTVAHQQRVFRNTLAVQAVATYLAMMEIPIDLAASHSWHYTDRRFADVADLCIPGWGCLECRPVDTGVSHWFVPPEVWSDRRGYVVVALEPSFSQAKLLGFLASVCTDTVPIANLQSLETLLSLFVPAIETEWTRLSHWLQQEFTDRWQPFRNLQDHRIPILAFLGNRIAEIDLSHPNSGTEAELAQLLTVTDDEETRWRAAEALWSISPQHPATGVRRVLDLGMLLAGRAVALLVAILPKPDQSLAILLRVYPTQAPHLPTGLSLTGLDDLGEPFLAAEAKEMDNYMQLKFSADPGERFQVEIKLGEVSMVEIFIV